MPISPGDFINSSIFASRNEIRQIALARLVLTLAQAAAK
jgi:hypothetical protein